MLIACLAVEAGVLGLGIDDLDEGYFVQQGSRVLHGQIPFRDFATLYSPGLAYLHAIVFSLTGGPSLMAARAVSLLARASLAVALFAVARPFVRNPWWAAAPGLVLLVGLDDAPARWEPHPGWLSTLFAVLAAWCLIHRPKRRWCIAAAVLAALSYAFKQNTGIYMLLALLAWCGTRRLWLPLATFSGTTLVWLVPLALVVGDPRQLAPLVGEVNGASLFSTPEATLAIPLAALVGGVWFFRRDSDPRLRWLLIAGAALVLTEVPRMDTLHLAWSAPLLLVVGAIVLDRHHPRLAVMSLVLTAALLFPTLSYRGGMLTMPLAPVDGVMAPVQTASDIDRTVTDIRERTTPDEPIFVYPTSPLLYPLSQRPNPTRFDHLNPGSATPEDIERVIADLQSSRVRLVVISDFWEGGWGTPGANALLETWLGAHFQEVARHGAYRVLVAGL